MSVIDEVKKAVDRQKSRLYNSEALDDSYTNGELLLGAGYFLDFVAAWPFMVYPKIGSRREDLLRAAAFIVSEIERMDREEEK